MARILVALVLLLAHSLCAAFMPPFPGLAAKEDEERVPVDHALPTAISFVSDASDDAAGTLDPVQGSGDPERTVFRTVLQYPFESVMHFWENGPKDANFVREELGVQTRRSEETCKEKTIYVKNPLPFLVRKAVCADDTLVFKEKQRMSVQKRYTLCESTMVTDLPISIDRSSSMFADPKNPEFTIFEQSCIIRLLGAPAFASAIQNHMESLFISSIKAGTATLEATLREHAHETQPMLRAPTAHPPTGHASWLPASAPSDPPRRDDTHGGRGQARRLVDTRRFLAPCGPLS